MIEVNGTTYFQIPDLVQKLGKTARTVRSYCKSGTIQGHKVGREWVVSPDALREYLNTPTPANPGRPARMVVAGKRSWQLGGNVKSILVHETAGRVDVTIQMSETSQSYSYYGDVLIEWLDDDDTWRCSVCGREFFKIDPRYGEMMCQQCFALSEQV